MSKLSSKYTVPANPPVEMPASFVLDSAGYYHLKVDILC